MIAAKHFLPPFFVLLFSWPPVLTHAAGNGSIVLTPSKLEIAVRPGEAVERQFTIINQSEDSVAVSLHFENLAAPADPRDGAALAEGLTPIFPLAPYLASAKQNFTLSPRSRTAVPIAVRLPENSPPGGFYGAAVFSITPPGGDSVAGSGVVTRLAGLLFLRVDGPMVERGALLDFNLLGRAVRLSSQPPTFYLTYQNTGAIYLNPYGAIELKNRLGGEEMNLPIDPWFVLPGGTRIREIAPAETLPTGWYEAQLSLHRGYNDRDVVDKRSVKFIIVPPFFLVGVGLALFFLSAAIFQIRSRRIVLAIIFVLVFSGRVSAEIASSTNYRLQSDSLNFGGLLSTSTNYGLEDTIGEIGTGVSTSTNYNLLAGYQQMVSSIIAITAPTDVALSAIAGTGVSSGSVAWTVTTDGPAGYTLSIKAGSDPALTSGADSFSDYGPVGAVPDYDWTVAASASAFGFSPEGADIAIRYLNSGSTCGAGASDTADRCWDGFSTINRTIAQSSAANTPSGVATTVKLKAEVGSGKTQPAGSYAATLTATAMPR